jgi:hypothetical protein
MVMATDTETTTPTTHHFSLLQFLITEMPIQTQTQTHLNPIQAIPLYPPYSVLPFLSAILMAMATTAHLARVLQIPRTWILIQIR